MKPVDYSLLIKQLRALLSGVPNRLSNLANAAALLFETLPEINWAGFYLAEGETLWLGPFQGKTACVKIPFGRGVCGTAAEKGESVLVEDVHAFPGHIACDGASNAEIVIPLFDHGSLFGVLDLDSPRTGRFTAADRQGLEAFARALEECWNGSPGAVRSE